MMDLQRQMVNNNSDIQEYLKGLDNWEDEIRIKEDSVSKQSPEDDAQQALPPVRGSLDKKKRKKKPKIKPVNEIETPNKKSAAPRNYRQWDKFDVDAECDKVDVASSSSGSESEYETDEEGEEMRKKGQAQLYKDQGNQFFKETKYTEAIECYTRGITSDPYNSILPANRAMALLKQDMYGAAELDCTTSISIDPTYLKAYLRRGTARIGLNKLREALDDFKVVLDRDPENKQAAKEVANIDKILQPPCTSQTLTVEDERGVIQPISKLPAQRSKKPLRRMVIEEIGDDREEEQRAARSQAQASHSAAAKQVQAKDGQLFDRLHQAVIEEEATASTSPADDLRLKIEDITSDKVNGDDKDTCQSNSSQLPTSKTQVAPNAKPVISSSQAPSPISSPRCPKLPTTSYQFQADWKVLRNKPEMFYQYFKNIPCCDFGRLFGNCLESDMLTLILHTMQDEYLPQGDDIYEPLQRLTAVKRFSMTTMFLSKKDVKVVVGLISHLRTQGKHTEEQLSTLQKKYCPL